MAEIVNLNRTRKTRQRAADDARAASNRVRFGRSKAERAGIRQAEARARAALEGRRIEAADGPEPRAPGDANVPTKRDGGAG